MIYPGFINVANIAAKWAKADVAWKAGDKKPRQNFINSWLGECWVEKEKETDASKLITHIGIYKKETIPDGVQMITLGIDVQMDHIWFKAVGWGYRSEAWSIEEGRIETGDIKQIKNWAAVEELIIKNWHYENNDKHTLSAVLTAVDCGDFQEVVIEFCARMQSLGLAVIPTKGSGIGKYEIFTTVKIRGGKMLRYDLNVNNIKNRLYRQLYEIKDSGPGYWHLHTETSQEVLDHLSSEEQVSEKSSHRKEMLRWQPKGHRPNHLWDAAVYAAAAAEIAGVHTLRAIDDQPKKNEKFGKETKTEKPIKTHY